MGPAGRVLGAVTAVPPWLVREVRLWAAAISGTRAARRRRRVEEAETELLVPVSPHVGRPGARHAAPHSEFTLKALQRRAMTSFGILVLAAVLGGLTGALAVRDGGRVGPQVVPADSNEVTPASPRNPVRQSSDVAQRGGPAPEPQVHRAGRPQPNLPEAQSVEGGPRPSSPNDPGAMRPRPTASPSASPSSSPSQEPTTEPTPSQSPSSEPSPSPSDTTLPGPQTGDGGAAGGLAAP